MKVREAAAKVLYELDNKLRIEEILEKATRKAEKAKSEIKKNPFSFKALAVGASVAAGTFAVGYALRELLSQTVIKTYPVETEGNTGIMYLVDERRKEVTAEEFKKVILDQPASELLKAEPWVSDRLGYPSEKMTIGEYLEKLPEETRSYITNYYLIKRGWSYFVKPGKITYTIYVNEITKVYPFSLLSLLGASVASGFLSAVAYSLKGVAKTFKRLGRK
jgi:hypothetical protein